MYSLRTIVVTCSKDSDVNTEDGDDNAEQDQHGHLADKPNSDQNSNKHQDEKARSIDTIVVKCVGRH